MSSEEQPIRPVRVGEEEGRPGALEEFTSKDLAERDARPFFFRHVTVIVKFCVVILLAGQQVACFTSTIVTDRVSREGKAMGSVRLSVCLFVPILSFEPTDL